MSSAQPACSVPAAIWQQHPAEPWCQHLTPAITSEQGCPRAALIFLFLFYQNSNIKPQSLAWLHSILTARGSQYVLRPLCPHGKSCMGSRNLAPVWCDALAKVSILSPGSHVTVRSPLHHTPESHAACGKEECCTTLHKFGHVEELQNQSASPTSTCFISHWWKISQNQR